MENATIVNLLNNSGLMVFGIDESFVYIRDPSCIFPAFDSIFNYAWIAILFFIAVMLFGWGILYIKNGVKLDSIVKNGKAIILILGIFAAVKPIVNFIYGDDLFARQCERKKISLVEVHELLEQRKKTFSQSDTYFLEESFSVIDSGMQFTTNDQNESMATPENQPEITSNNYARSDIVGVENAGNATVYIMKNGDKIKRSGGTVAWRNNNPGNIIKSEFAMKNGAVGSSGRWAVFADEQTGLNAITKLLKTKNYINLSINQAINRWAPMSDGNDTNAYVNYVSKTTGLNANDNIKNLSDNDLMKIARAIQKFEGWEIGTEEKITQ